MIDFHSHILPAIDDGSADLEESLGMLRLSAAHDVGLMIATPHFYADAESPARFLRRRSHAYQALREGMSGQEAILPMVLTGAEIAYYEGISDCETLADMKIDGTPLVLVEMPMTKWSDRAVEELGSIYDKTGLIPLVAHIDRFIQLQHDRRLAERLRGLPVLIQANASFFLNRRYSRLAFSMMERGEIHLLGSDCHNLTTRRPNLLPAMQAIRDKLGEAPLQRVEANGRRVFTDNPKILEAMFL
ncbi:MAG: capsular polysaccharide biosynthesis protein [Clostridia bacterium]|nr:capsular polysaccharide biosynthesis protein [Clostridia bacterium]